MKKMKILLFGKTGQVGRSILEANNSNHQIISCDRNEMPLDDQEKLSKNLNLVLDKNKINFLINAAAYTNVEEAEKNVDLAFEVNSNSLKTITDILKKRRKEMKIILLHLSTDYVFDGSLKTSWKPNAKKNPLNVYGQSKAMGESIINNSGLPFLILRTSWVFSHRGNNFLRKVLKKLAGGEKLQIVNDQIGSPTSSDFISEFCLYLIQNSSLHNKSGIYHLTSKGITTWFDFAKYIAETADEIGIFETSKLDFSISKQIVIMKIRDGNK